jgi:hypothetical protein
MSNEERVQVLQQQIMATKARMLDYKMQFEEGERELVALVAQLNALSTPNGEALPAK